MTDYSITQEQIKSLLDEVSIEERVRNQFILIRTKIGRMLNRFESRELLRIQKDLQDRMKTLEAGGPPYPQEFIDAFKGGIKNRVREILQVTQDFALFELAVKLENLIAAMFYDINQEQRRFSRFPLTIDLFLTLGEKTHLLPGIDISSEGLAFYAPVALSVGRRYTVTTRITDGEEMAVDVLRTRLVERRPPGVWQTACTFPNLMAWERIREIVSKTMGGLL